MVATGNFISWKSYTIFLYDASSARYKKSQVEIMFLRWLVPVFHARANVRLPTREDPPARKAKQIWRRSALFAKGYLAHFEKKFVFTRDCITKKVLSCFEIWKKSASGAQCSCFRYKWALVL